MAENESLDLGQPGGQRWKHVLDAVRKKKSSADIARQVELKMPQALRKAFKELAECGVPFDEFMKCRDDTKELKRLVRKCDGHEFAHLFEQTAAISSGEDDRQLLGSYLHGVLDRVVDQITHKVVGAEWESIDKVRTVFKEVRKLIKPDMDRIARNLDKNHGWNPTVKKRNQEEKAKDTQSLMRVSLLGDKKQ